MVPAMHSAADLQRRKRRRWGVAAASASFVLLATVLAVWRFRLLSGWIN
jgi:hypothetical protein